ncbi:hypothetical protein, partial [Desulfocastanea catecholica]
WRMSSFVPLHLKPHSRFDGFDTSKKFGSGTGLNFGGQKFTENLAGGGLMQNPMELLSRLFNCTQ